MLPGLFEDGDDNSEDDITSFQVILCLLAIYSQHTVNYQARKIDQAVNARKRMPGTRRPENQDASTKKRSKS